VYLDQKGTAQDIIADIILYLRLKKWLFDGISRLKKLNIFLGCSTPLSPKTESETTPMSVPLDENRGYTYTWPHVGNNVISPLRWRDCLTIIAIAYATTRPKHDTDLLLCTIIQNARNLNLNLVYCVIPSPVSCRLIVASTHKSPTSGHVASLFA